VPPPETPRAINAQSISRHAPHSPEKIFATPLSALFDGRRPVFAHPIDASIVQSMHPINGPECTRSMHRISRRPACFMRPSLRTHAINGCDQLAMIKITQPWQKRLEASDKPAYLLLADLIAEDIRTGRLTARDKLPTLRDLAAELRLNYTTVARGYAEARKRGLIDSRAGTGTFIRGTSPAVPLRGGGGAEMTMNLPPEPQAAGRRTARPHEGKRGARDGRHRPLRPAALPGLRRHGA
jgi:hypothetical protein